MCVCVCVCVCVCARTHAGVLVSGGETGRPHRPCVPWLCPSAPGCLLSCKWIIKHLCDQAML